MPTKKRDVVTAGLAVGPRSQRRDDQHAADPLEHHKDKLVHGSVELDLKREDLSKDAGEKIAAAVRAWEERNRLPRGIKVTTVSFVRQVELKGGQASTKNQKIFVYIDCATADPSAELDHLVGWARDVMSAMSEHFESATVYCCISDH